MNYTINCKEMELFLLPCLGFTLFRCALCIDRYSFGYVTFLLQPLVPRSTKNNPIENGEDYCSRQLMRIVKDKNQAYAEWQCSMCIRFFFKRIHTHFLYDPKARRRVKLL